MHSTKHIQTTPQPRATGASGGERHRVRRTLHVLALALPLAALALALQGCGRGADSGATANPNAPGRPGTGNPAVEITARPESITESPQIGGARGMVPEGITGSGGPTDYPGELQSRGAASAQQQPGVGLDGGLDDGAARRAQGLPGTRAGEVDSGATGS